MRRAWMLLGLVGLSGCLPLTEERTTLVGGNPFNQPAKLAPVTQVNYSPASKEAALRVDQAGQKLIQGNPQLGFHPLFATIGSPRLELFHTAAPIEAPKPGEKTLPPLMGSRPVIYITEGLVKRCPSEIELTAVLSYEIGRIQSEREEKVNPDIRSPERMPPIRVPIGNMGDSSGFSSDMTAAAELAKFERRFPKRPQPLPPPDPRKVATTVLERAGFPPTALEVIEPLLQEADHQAALERQIKGGVVPTWVPQ